MPARKPTITLCASAKFFDKLSEIENALTELRYKVLLPSMVDYHHLEETALMKIHHDLIRDHFKKISKSDAIYVANFEKNGIAGYVGGSNLLEMGKAFDKGIPIFLMFPPPVMNYREEILAMQPIVIGTNWDLIAKNLKKS